MKIKNDIINLRKPDFDERFGKLKFTPEKTYIPPPAKELDVEDCVLHIDASEFEKAKITRNIND